MTTLVLATLAILLFGAGKILSQSNNAALASFTSETLLKHIRVLASDEFEGRAPATKGEALTVRYLIEQFKAMGLKPGNPDGTFLQKVPLMGFTSDVTGEFQVGAQKMALRPVTDYVAVCHRFVSAAKVDHSDVVFVGYGIVAPEYGWDDYKGADVKGKTIVMLVNDPPVPDPADPAKLDEKMFKGKAMTYYGRWTYKYEIATEKGAAAAIIVHETGAAGYPFEVVSESWGRENFDIRNTDGNMRRPVVEAWISIDAARHLFQLAGMDYAALKKDAASKAFKPVSLNAKASFTVRNTLRRVESNNVVARWEGSDPKLKNEYVVYTAHWDHLGRNPKLAGDQIFNGALDNASGVAGLLNLAKAYTLLPAPPKRSVLFLSVTAEEKGLLGSKYFAEHPLYPLPQIVANINMDALNPWGRTRDVVAVGLGSSTLDEVLTEAARTQGRVVRPDPEPEKGSYYRSDHFEFARQGVPALDVGAGIEYAGKPADYGLQKRQQYTRNDYHKVSDEIKSDWDLSGAVEDLQLLFMVGNRVAGAAAVPSWNPGAEFKPVRDKMMK
jgi:Zn-dependent M28 family amino/carboxypeptidase